MQPNQSSQEPNIKYIQIDFETFSLPKEQCVLKTNEFVNDKLILLKNARKKSLDNQVIDMQAGWKCKPKIEWDAELQGFDELIERFDHIPDWTTTAPHKIPEAIRRMLAEFKTDFMLEEETNTKKFLKLVLNIIERHAITLDEEINPCRNMGPNPFAIRRTSNNHNL